MREKPILFSTEMVQAILEGRKTQTRRVIKDKDIINRFDIDVDGKPIAYIDQETGDSFPPTIRCRYQAGDILWVRETWADLRGMGFGNNPITDKPWSYSYKADIETGSDSDRARIDYGVKWKRSIYMPRTAARIFLKVKNVRVERLQDITEEDAKAEGVTNYWAEPHKDTPPFIGAAKEPGEYLCFTRRKAFQQLWDSLNKKRGYGWNTNPWVWVIEFERVEVPKC